MAADGPGGHVPQTGDEVCVLVSASCTIAWVDLDRGALWLCPSGVLRVPLDQQVLSQQRTGPTVDPDLPWEATFTKAQFDDATRRGGGFRWFPRASIAGASFEPGPSSNALHLTLRDKSRVKFLWLSADGGGELVEEWIEAGAG
jgi:hypothetical protein